MMKWGRKKHVSWFSKLSGSSELKPGKEKKQEDEASQKMSAKSSLNSTKLGNDRSKRLQRVSVDKEKAETRSADMEANGRFEEIMSSMRKKARKFQRETRGFLDVEAKDRDKGTVIMTPRIQVNREKQRWERRDQKLLQQKAKRSEQETDAKMKKLATRSYSRKDFVKLKETKLREVMLKADQRRKSMHLGTKENNKVRVFSPRACRVKAIEDLKKAKLRADGGGMENENFAVVKCSSDARKDFRDSMVEMIMENGINHPKELKELLVCYLTLNTDEYHDMIINVFHQVQSDLSLR